MFVIPQNVVECMAQADEGSELWLLSERLTRTEDGTILVPGHTVVCPRCGGNGHHDHPAFSNGFTREDDFVDDEFIEEYMRGTYDVQCEECHGRNVVQEPNVRRMSSDQRKAYDYYCEYMASMRETDAIYAAERRMGA